MIPNSIAIGKLNHIRNSPSFRKFGFNHTMILLNLSDGENAHLPWPLTRKKHGFISIFSGNHISDSRNSLIEKIYNSTSESDLTILDSDTILMLSAPAIIGYSFNPASFYFVFDDKKHFKGSIVEVHNTFKESHLYKLSSNAGSTTKFEGFNIKQFHVSPFLDREGYYKFNFSLNSNIFDIQINLFQEDKFIFGSRYKGKLVILSTKNLIRNLPRLILTVTLTEIRILTNAAIIFFIHKMPFFEKPDRLEGTNDSPAVGFISRLKIPFK